MKDKQFSIAQIASILQQLEEGSSIDDICREHNINTNTLNNWKTRYGRIENLEKKLTELEEENYKLKGMLADINIQREAKNTGDTDHIYRILAANIPGTAITILDTEERYLLAEGDFLRTMGYTKETMPGKKISEVISPENYEGYYKAVIKRAFSGEAISTERQTITGHHTQMKVVPLKNGTGEIFAIMFVLLDITMVKQVQLELKKLNEGLESKILERTAQLNDANKRLESFCYSVTHDLRAPLRAIANYARILQDDYADSINDEAFDSSINRMIANTSKMETLIEDLLNFSKSEVQELSYSPIDMNKLVHEILNEFTLNETSRRLDIQVSPLVMAYGDVNLVRQIWVNLISNALKYTRKKDFTKIEINCTHDHETACYSISDNGAGFNMKYIDKLFGVFQRFHNAEDFEGTGVGLALTKSIVLRHGGKIWAESEIDKGSQFYFTLPLQK